MWHRYADYVASAVGLKKILSFCEAPAYLLLDVAPSNPDALHTLLGGLDMIDAIESKNERERRDIWRIREESFLIDSTVPHCQWFDISVPLDRIDEMVAAIEARIAAIDPAIGVWVMGHLGDGNLHYTIGSGEPTADAQKKAVAAAVYDGLKQIGGSFSAEHGIGTDKRASLKTYADPEKLRLMQEIKRVFDPHGIMNPGKVLPD